MPVQTWIDTDQALQSMVNINSDEYDKKPIKHMIYLSLNKQANSL